MIKTVGLDDLRVEIETACDMLQIIYEQVEGELMTDGNPATYARGTMVLSALIVTRDYIRAICPPAGEEGQA